MYLATKTLDAIDQAITKDNGNAFRHWQGKVLPHIGDAYQQEDLSQPFRKHMGASVIGRECPRAIWYSFRWAYLKQHISRMRRLFNRGHLEEGRFIALLLMIGVEVYQHDENGKQFRISDAGGHFGGSGDGVAYGIPDLDPGTPALLEFKTSAEKAFVKVKANGVQVEKPEHFAQMQVYMTKMGLSVALYMIINKNTDEIHAELIRLEADVADHFINKGQKLVFTREPPPRISESPSWYKCKFCDMKPVCHDNIHPFVSCRSCDNVECAVDGTWKCHLDSDSVKVLSTEDQYKACESYTRSF